MDFEDNKIIPTEFILRDQDNKILKINENISGELFEEIKRRGWGTTRYWRHQSGGRVTFFLSLQSENDQM